MAKGVVNPFDEASENDAFAAAEGLFEAPTISFEQLATKENKGKLMLVTPTGFLEKVKTKYTKPGEEGSDAVQADAVVFEEDGTATTLEGTLIFQKMVIGQLRGRIGKGKPPVLAVLSQQPSQKGHPAWVLDPELVTAEQVQTAKKYLLNSMQVDAPDATA